jgi:DNA-binding LacI/PurR family transcriptional regulator
MDLNYSFRWQQLAHRLIDDLVRRPDTNLPGIQVLGKQYKVSRVTVERALNYLEELGVITPAQRGKRRQVNLAKLQKIVSQRENVSNRILFLSSVSTITSPLGQAIYNEFHMLCEQENLFLSHMKFPANSAEMHALFTSLKPRGLIFYTPPVYSVKVARELNIPLVGINTKSKLTSCFYTLLVTLIFDAFRQAHVCGHRLITSPFVGVSFERYESFAEKLKELFGKYDLSFSRHYNLPFVASNDAEEYRAVLNDLFRYTPPTCLILFDLSHYLVVISFFLERGLKIPADVSIILLSDHPLLVDVFPTVAHFRLYPDDMPLQAFRVLQEQMRGLQIHREVVSTPIWVPGDSLAPPR